MRVSSGEQHSTKAPQVRMLDYPLHEAERNTFAAVLRQDIDVGKIAESCFVGHHAGKADLPALMERPKAQGIFYRALDNGARNAGRPVGLSQKAMNRRYVEACFVA